MIRLIVRTPRVLIWEPSAEVAGLLERAVRCLGYDPVRWRPGEDVPHADVVVLEPVASEELEIALLGRDPAVSVVYLAKPFALADLRRAVAEAAASPGSTRRLLPSG